MPSIMDFLGMIGCQQMGRQQLDRIEEPSSITDSTENVTQYDEVMATKLVLAYAAGLEIVYWARPQGKQEQVVDIACGPGHFTLCLARHLDYRSITGVDLSPPMVEIANRNAKKQGLSHRVSFQVADAMDLAEIDSNTCDLATFTDAAHHMPDLNAVRKVIKSMDRITRPQGLVMVMDLVRLRTRTLTERYVSLLGHDYIERGLPNFFEDFHNSMYAAWTASELRQAIPPDTDRYWCHLVPRGLPTIQVILGLPVGRRRPFLRAGVPWSNESNLIPRAMRTDWRMMRATLALAARTFIPPQTHSGSDQITTRLEANR